MKLSLQLVRDIVSITLGAILILAELLGWLLTGKQPNPTIVFVGVGAVTGPGFWNKDKPGR
jgi:hypothetical protein